MAAVFLMSGAICCPQVISEGGCPNLLCPSPLVPSPWDTAGLQQGHSGRACAPWPESSPSPNWATPVGGWEPPSHPAEVVTSPQDTAQM